jgi:hypothetical protein
MRTIGKGKQTNVLRKVLATFIDSLPDIRVPITTKTI